MRTGDPPTRGMVAAADVQACSWPVACSASSGHWPARRKQSIRLADRGRLIPASGRLPARPPQVNPVASGAEPVSPARCRLVPDRPGLRVRVRAARSSACRSWPCAADPRHGGIGVSVESLRGAAPRSVHWLTRQRSLRSGLSFHQTGSDRPDRGGTRAVPRPRPPGGRPGGPGGRGPARAARRAAVRGGGRGGFGPGARCPGRDGRWRVGVPAASGDSRRGGCPHPGANRSGATVPGGCVHRLVRGHPRRGGAARDGRAGRSQRSSRSRSSRHRLPISG